MARYESHEVECCVVDGNLGNKVLDGLAAVLLRYVADVVFLFHDYVKSEELKSVPATLSRKPFFVGHITGDGCASYYFTPLFKAAVRVELKATLRTFLLKSLSD